MVPVLALATVTTETVFVVAVVFPPTVEEAFVLVLLLLVADVVFPSLVVSSPVVPSSSSPSLCSAQARITPGRIAQRHAAMNPTFASRLEGRVDDDRGSMERRCDMEASLERQDHLNRDGLDNFERTALDKQVPTKRRRKSHISVWRWTKGRTRRELKFETRCVSEAMRFRGDVSRDTSWAACWLVRQRFAVLVRRPFARVPQEATHEAQFAGFFVATAFLPL
jgi:hypothetical protein